MALRSLNSPAFGIQSSFILLLSAFLLLQLAGRVPLVTPRFCWPAGLQTCTAVLCYYPRYPLHWWTNRYKRCCIPTLRLPALSFWRIIIALDYDESSMLHRSFGHHTLFVCYWSTCADRHSIWFGKFASITAKFDNLLFFNSSKFCYLKRYLHKQVFMLTLTC
jgi:hypothetical protein